MRIDWLTRLYTLFMRCYPRSFQAEFGEEMCESFRQAAEEAAAKSHLALGRLLLNELAGLPAALALARSQTHSKQQTGPAGSLLDQSWKELLLALAVFLLPAGMMWAHQGSIQLPTGLLFLGVMIVLGWLGGFPLWSLPYVGLVTIIAGYLYLFQWVAGLINPSLISTLSPGPLDPTTRVLLEIASTGMLWLMLFCLTLFIVALLAVFNRFQPLLIRTGSDWTLLSYLLYGESFFALLLLFESRRYDPNYAIASLFCLLAGVWLYQHSSRRGQRVLALVGCLTLAVGVAALEPGRALEGLAGGGLKASESGRLLLSWLWMAAALLLPGLLSRLPERQEA